MKEEGTKETQISEREKLIKAIYNVGKVTSYLALGATSAIQLARNFNIPIEPSLLSSLGAVSAFASIDLIKHAIESFTKEKSLTSDDIEKVVADEEIKSKLPDQETVLSAFNELKVLTEQLTRGIPQNESESLKRLNNIQEDMEFLTLMTDKEGDKISAMAQAIDQNSNLLLNQVEWQERVEWKIDKLIAHNIDKNKTNILSIEDEYLVNPESFHKAMITFAKFHSVNTQEEPGQDWFNIVYEEMQEVITDSEISLSFYEKEIKDEKQAREFLKKHNNHIVVWGTIGKKYIKVNYTSSIDEMNFIKNSYLRVASDPAKLHPESGIVDMPTFTSYIEEGDNVKFMLTVLSGLLNIKKGYPQKAIDQFSAALEMAKLEPSEKMSEASAEVANLKGCTYLILNDKSRAREVFESSLSMNSLNPHAYNNLGTLFLGDNKFKKAIEYFSKSISFDPTNTMAYANRGLAYNLLGELDLALSDFEKALEIDSTFALVYNNRAALYCDIGHFDEAIRDLNKSILNNPNSSTSYLDIGQIYLDRQNYGKAISAFLKAIEIGDRNISAYHGLGAAYLESGDYKESVKAYTEVVELDSRDYNAYLNRAAAYLSLNDYEEAKKDCNKAIEIDDKEIYAYEQRGTIYKLVHEYEKAIEDFKTIINLEATYAPAYFKRADLFCRIGNFEDAIRDYEKYMALNPEDSERTRSLIALLRDKIYKPIQVVYLAKSRSFTILPK